ncbi:MAG: cell division protein FtsA [Candidatus Blackburnbacteria bacterium RIFCSPHIGHO2_01_FULL_43_15b]|uniref:Cell division protein FtsA n=1 Tax=Candidatus Blackburnbacteria bacterium RIFCSPHIGHO2_01_FULL_43_15b TaxID=1797513 RepID=A0A1G1V1T7_9BACT|nr:MAG: cell division protein FtsA [Candidatus Blackburnbacteria bacterium RIFCSPHIGHO2_01_FULL_43_15b]
MVKSRVISGIDVGSSKVVSLIAQYDELEDKISVTGVGTVPSKGVRKGQIVDIDEAASAVIESVEQAERMAGYGIKSAYVNIGGGHIDSRNSNGVVAVADPSGEISGSDIERVIDAARAVSLPESREILHVIPKEYKVDGETQVKDPKGMSGVRLEVETHLITGSVTAVKNIQKAVSEVGVRPQGLVFSGLASSMAILSDTERELGVVLVDIGAGTTSIVVYVEGSIAHSSVLPIGSKNVTNDIAAGLRVSLDSAEKIKVMLGERKKKSRTDENPEADELDLKAYGVEEGDRKVSEKTLAEGIIKPRLNEILTMVGMNLADSNVAGKTPSGIVLTGGGALCVGAVESARRMLSLPTRLGIPRGVSGLIDDVNTPVFASSVGLLIYAAQSHPDSKESWSPSRLISRFRGGLPVKGLIGRASELFKKILP